MNSQSKNSSTVKIWVKLLCVCFILLLNSCKNDKITPKASITIKEIDAESLPYALGGDTIIFNKRISKIFMGKKDTSLVIGNWFIMGNGNDAIYYVIYEKSTNGFTYAELNAFDAKNKLLGKKVLADTAFIFQSPKTRTARAYRKSNWVYIESGFLPKKDSISIMKAERFEIRSILGSKFDKYLYKSKVDQ